MTGKEAIQKLKDAGFTLLYVDSSGHQHLGRGEDTMMISGHKQSLDSNIAQDVMKLCRGGTPTHVAARTVRRMEVHVHGKPGTGKTYLVPPSFKRGDYVSLIRDPSTKGVVNWINPRDYHVTVRWSSGLTDTMNRDALQKEEGMPEEEEVTKQETLWDKLVDLGSVAEKERIALAQIYEELHERALAYERVRAISQTIQVPIDPLPFVFDGILQIETAVEVGEDDTKDEPEFDPPPGQAMEALKDKEAATRPHPKQRERGTPIGPEHIIDWLSYHGGGEDWVKQADILRHFTGMDATIAKTLIGTMVREGRIRQKTTNGRFLKLVTD